MKYSFQWVLCLCLIGMPFFSCEDKVEILDPVNVQFSCSVSSLEKPGGRILDIAIPETLLISIEDNSGTPIYTREEVKLLRVGDQFISDPLELFPGIYRVTDFLLIDDLSNVLYAVPQRGSSLSEAVDESLPYNLRITRDDVSNQNFEVIDVTAHEPEEFGYASFTFDIVNPISLSVLILNGMDFVMTDAKAHVIYNLDTIESYDLEAEVNQISFEGDPAFNHRLIISKDGYETYSLDFVYEDLIISLGGEPLKVILNALEDYTILAYVDGTTIPANYFEFSMAGNNSPITIDWGDGTSESHTVSPGLDEFTHTYSSSGNFEVTLSGNVNEIFHFKTYYGAGMIDSIKLEDFTNLRALEMGLTRSPATIDLSSNLNIVTVSMPGTDRLENLILPAENQMRLLELEGPNMLTTEDLDDIINKIYQSAVLHDEMYGKINLASYWVPPYTGMLGPPSESAMVQLRALKDVYSWEIIPEPSSFTMLAWVDATINYEFQFSMDGMGAALDINWGDGTEDSYLITGFQDIVHVYPTAGNYLISVFGDLDQITRFYSFYGAGPIDAINVSGLTQINSFRLGLTRGPENIDLSNNPLLEDVLVAGLFELEELILPEDNRIRSINVAGPNLLDTEDIDHIVDRVYQTAVLYNTQNGSLDISVAWSPPPFDPIGPPSTSAMDQIIALDGVYNWTVLPFEY